MIRLFTFVLLFIANFLSAQTVEIEAIFDENGSWIIGKTKDERRQTWAEVLIRGTHFDRPNDGFLDNVPFVDSLYSKWYHRVVKLTSGVKDTVPPAGMDRRTHGNQDGIIRAYDYPKKSLRANLMQAIADIQNTAIFDSLQNDEIEDVVEWERWPWGRKERKLFSTMRFTDMNQTRLDSMRLDSVRWRIPPAVFRDSLNLDVTLRQINNNVQVPQKLKTWFQNNVLGRAGITLDTTLWELITTHRKKAKQLWLRHPIIANKLKARWLKRQQGVPK